MSELEKESQDSCDLFTDAEFKWMGIFLLCLVVAGCIATYLDGKL